MTMTMNHMCLIHISYRDEKLSEHDMLRLAEELDHLGVASRIRIQPLVVDRFNSWGLWFRVRKDLTKEDVSQIVHRRLGRVNDLIFFFDALYEEENPLPHKVVWLSKEVHGKNREEALRNAVSTMDSVILSFLGVGYGSDGDQYVIDAAVISEDVRYVKSYYKRWLPFGTMEMSVCLQVQVTASFMKFTTS